MAGIAAPAARGGGANIDGAPLTPPTTLDPGPPKLMPANMSTGAPGFAVAGGAPSTGVTAGAVGAIGAAADAGAIRAACIGRMPPPIVG